MTESPVAPPAGVTSTSLAASDPRDAEVREMLRMVVSALVDDAKSMELICIADQEGAAFQVRTAPADIGKLIGKSGRTARAIRTILNGSAVKNRRRYTLDIAHSPGQMPSGEAGAEIHEEN